jgi:hypothetical protein
MAEGSERDFDRVRAPLRARVRAAGRVVHFRPVRDIGLGGVCIQGAEWLRPGDACDLELDPEGDETGEDGWRILATGRVVRVQPGYGTAIEFTEMNLESFDRLDQLVVSRSRKGRRQARKRYATARKSS